MDIPVMVIDIFKYFFSTIDNILFFLIQVLISIFDYIATVPLWGDRGPNGIIAAFYTRIFYFVSVVMIFKVSFSIIQYIINPDKFSNGENGFGKIIQGIIISLIGLVVVTPVFDFAMKLQHDIMDKDVIPSLILGINGGSKSEENVTRRIPFYLAQAFVRPRTEFQDALNSRTDGISTTRITTDYDHGFSVGVATAYNEALESDKYDYSILFSLVTAKNDGQGYNNADTYIFEYRPIISTACAIFVIIMYLNFCIDVAIRTVKLGFLEIIAPIPIISMVDPKSSKSGMMNKWLKNCFSTYAGLFVRIAAVNFVVFGVRQLMDVFDQNAENEMGLFANVVIIFGLLMFAKELPKLISDITGIDLKGDFKINPLKRVSENAIMKPIGTVGAAALGGAIGAAGGLAANAVALRNNWGNMSGKERLSSIAGLGTGALSAGIRGTFSKEKNILKKASTGIQGSVAARNLRDARAVEGIGGPAGAINRAISGVHNWAGVEEGATAYEKELNTLSQMETSANEILTRANSEMIKYELLTFKDDVGHNVSMRDFKIAKETLNSLRNKDTTGMTNAQLMAHNTHINDLQTSIALTEKNAEQAYINAVMSGTLVKNDGSAATDSVTFDKVTGLRNAASKSSYKNISSHSLVTGKDIKDFKDAMFAEQAAIKNSEAYTQALVNKKDSAATKK